MARQDDFVRYTIRVPAPLYEQLQASAGAKSVNAEIVRRLERSFELDDDTITMQERIDAMDVLLGDHVRQIDRLRSDVSRLMEREGLYDPNPD